ncbi:response regulator [Sphingobacteriaceae bacterium]|nr:response regulator [Sphingobacteriaceae bacterium]
MKTNYSIVMVDDDRDDQFFFKEALKGVYFSCSLTALYNGSQLIDYLFNTQKNLHKSPPDVIILDLNMPILNGLETLEKLRANAFFKGIPAYVLTTSRSIKESVKALDFGARGFYVKPTSYSKLEQIISEILITL